MHMRSTLALCLLTTACTQGYGGPGKVVDPPQVSVVGALADVGKGMRALNDELAGINPETDPAVNAAIPPNNSDTALTAKQAAQRLTLGVIVCKIQVHLNLAAKAVKANTANGQANVNYDGVGIQAGDTLQDSSDGSRASSVSLELDSINPQVCFWYQQHEAAASAAKDTTNQANAGAVGANKGGAPAPKTATESVNATISGKVPTQPPPLAVIGTGSTANCDKPNRIDCYVHVFGGEMPKGVK